MRNIFLYILLTISLISCKGQKEDFKVSVKPNSKEPEAVASKIQNKISLEQLECKISFEENDTYKLDCNNFSAYNNVFTAPDNNKYELITLKLKDIDKAIIRKINEEDLPTSGLYVYSNPSDKSFTNGEKHIYELTKNK